jgi:hypothetical protein
MGNDARVYQPKAEEILRPAQRYVSERLENVRECFNVDYLYCSVYHEHNFGVFEAI